MVRSLAGGQSLPAFEHWLQQSVLHMRATLTIRLPPDLRRELGWGSKGQGVSESELVRRAVQRQIWAEAFERTRRALVPKARVQGIYTDENVFKTVS